MGCCVDECKAVLLSLLLSGQIKNATNPERREFLKLGSTDQNRQPRAVLTDELLFIRSAEPFLLEFCDPACIHFGELGWGHFRPAEATRGDVGPAIADHRNESVVRFDNPLAICDHKANDSSIKQAADLGLSITSLAV